MSAVLLLLLCAPLPAKPSFWGADPVGHYALYNSGFRHILFRLNPDGSAGMTTLSDYPVPKVPPLKWARGPDDSIVLTATDGVIYRFYPPGRGDRYLIKREK